MKKSVLAKILLSVVVSVLLVGVLPANADTKSGHGMPFYVQNKTADYSSESLDLYRNRLNTEIEADPDALDYLLYESKSICVLYDDHARFAIASEKGLFLGTKRNENAIIQCCLTTDRMPCHSTYETHSVGLNYGGKLLFLGKNTRHVYSVFLLDWENLVLYEIADIEKFYGSSGGRYFVGTFQDKVYVFDLENARCNRVTVPSGTSFSRLTDDGGVIEHGSKYLYLSLRDASVYTTSLTGDIYFAGDDYYIREDSYAINVYLADGSTEKLIRKTDMDSFSQRDYHHGTAANVLWFGAPYHACRTYLLHNTWSEGYSELNEMDTLSIEGSLFPTATFDSGFFSNWYIMRTGSDQYFSLKEAKLSNRDTNTFRFTDTEYGYLGTLEYNYPNSQYEMITGKKGYRTGYYLYLFDENILENYVVAIPAHPNPDEVKRSKPGKASDTAGKANGSGADALILYLPFEGNTEDATGNVRVIAYGNVSFSEGGKDGKCAYFDGNGDYLGLGNGFNFENDFTISLWIRTESKDRNAAALFAKYETNGSGPYAFYLSANRPAAWITTGSGLSVFGSSSHVEDIVDVSLDDRWHMVTWTYSKAQKTITTYIDGAEKQSVTLSSDLKRNTDLVTIGRQALMFQPYKDLEYKGYMDEVRIYSKCLKPAEVRSLFTK